MTRTRTLIASCTPLLMIAIAVGVVVIRRPAPVCAASSAGAEITGVFVDVSRLSHDADSNGDTWDYIWADDDNIYTFNCDGRGYGKHPRNLSFNRLVGTQWDRLTGSQVNEMGYGAGGEKCANGSNWKVTGADSIDGVIYAFVANNWYGNQNAFGGAALDPNIRQTVNNMSLIKSTDKGLTWTRDAQTNYAHPMWTSRKFSTGFFVKYGQDGGRTSQDEQQKYVYAISNDGYWNCGSNFYLGRVLRSKIGDLNAADWQFLSNGQWIGRLEDASPVPGFPSGHMKCTMGSPIWIARLHKYVTVTWFDPGTTQSWHYPENVTFAFYQADHPWGPWAYLGEISAGDFIADTKQRISRCYGPSLSPKFITENPDGSVTAVLMFSGQLWDDKPSSLYKRNSCPVTFYTKPQPKEVRIANDTEAQYSPGWSYQPGRNLGDYHDDVHLTTAQGEYADFTFTGRGIEVISEKTSELGDVEVLIDGVSKGTFHCHQDPMPVLYQIPIFRDMNLPDRTHTLRVVNKAPNGVLCIIDGFRVYGGNDFDPDAYYMLVNRSSGKMLERSDRTAGFRHAQRGESPAFQWKIQNAGGGFYKIVNRDTGDVLGPNARPTEGAPLQPYKDGKSENYFWKITLVGNGTYAIVNRTFDLAMSAGGPAEGADSISQFNYFGKDSQKWEIVRVH